MFLFYRPLKLDTQKENSLKSRPNIYTHQVTVSLQCEWGYEIFSHFKTTATLYSIKKMWHTARGGTVNLKTCYSQGELVLEWVKWLEH